MVEFANVYYIKTLVRNERFQYTSKQAPDVEGVWGVHENMGNYNDRYFLYPSNCLGEFWVASKQ